jgi:hypothetical protein
VNVALPFNGRPRADVRHDRHLDERLLELGGNTRQQRPSNACLPTSQHTRPLIAYYWDDMQTQGTAIRYGTRHGRTARSSSTS